MNERWDDYMNQSVGKLAYARINCLEETDRFIRARQEHAARKGGDDCDVEAFEAAIAQAQAKGRSAMRDEK